MARKTTAFILTLLLLTQGFLFTAFGGADPSEGISAIDITALITYAMNPVQYTVAGMPSGSMAETVPQGAIIVVDRTYYAENEIGRQDIVLFALPGEENSFGLKRILGLPGETLKIRDGSVYINGEAEPIAEPYLGDSPKMEGSFGPYEIPENAYFLLGDNRGASLDSRYLADPFITGEAIDGKLIHIYQH